MTDIDKNQENQYIIPNTTFSEENDIKKGEKANSSKILRTGTSSHQDDN